MAKKLDDNKCRLYTGDAVGADTAFASVSSNKIIFRANDAAIDYKADELYKEVADIDISSWSTYVRNLIRRNTYQILGPKRQGPNSDLVICWTPTLDYTSFAAGGTRYACLVARHYKIPILNLFDSEARKTAERWVGL
jgi:hypothetical protein